MIEGIRAGELDRRIDILRATFTKNALNEEVPNWGTLVEGLSAKKRDVSDGERMRAQQVSAEITTRFTIRWSSIVSGVNSRDRVRCEGRTYDIFSVKEIGRRVGIEITGTARADG